GPVDSTAPPQPMVDRSPSLKLRRPRVQLLTNAISPEGCLPLPHELQSVMPDPLKDLSDLRKLFPELENYVPDPAESAGPEEDTALSAKEKSAMKLYVSRDKKQRAGKIVTLV